MTPCKNPKCRMDVTPNHSGRPKEYCDKRCRDAAYRRRSAVDASGAAEEGGYAAAVAADYTGHARLAETAALTPGADAARELLRLLRSSGLPRKIWWPPPSAGPVSTDWPRRRSPTPWA